MDSELAVGVLDVLAHGPLRYTQDVADRGGGETGRQQVDDLALAGREVTSGVSVDDCQIRVVEMVQQAGRDTGGPVTLSNLGFTRAARGRTA